MATRARIVAYKVCWVDGCFNTDILAALDKEVAYGVNVLSLLLGGGLEPYYRDNISLGTFGAMEKGVFVLCSAGNGGPDPISLSNVALWIATVGAGTLDRDFPAYVKLGNGMNFTDVSLYHGRRGLPPGKQIPLVYFGSNTSAGSRSSTNMCFAGSTNLCFAGSLDPKLVADKIVVCDRGLVFIQSPICIAALNGRLLLARQNPIILDLVNQLFKGQYDGHPAIDPFVGRKRSGLRFWVD